MSDACHRSDDFFKLHCIRDLARGEVKKYMEIRGIMCRKEIQHLNYCVRARRFRSFSNDTLVCGPELANLGLDLDLEGVKGSSGYGSSGKPRYLRKIVRKDRSVATNDFRGVTFAKWHMLIKRAVA